MSLGLDVFEPARAWRLSDRVSLRDEAFGALAYHHETRRLVFLKSRDLVELVRRLGEFESADDAVAALVVDAERRRYVAALSSLHASGILCGR